ncbi:hypothetical protein B0J13DRAFT_678572 [Dactylonectria estremocensis]|uniref:Uncharacterized protein n=1 Tax=Dactylonectria estremocensis TaxID=1079267 RepID=A0A9P9IUM4_9HYPO|nr:hypothetical protein B0J13DRAFT_678572 [Dactylonectria estremocensis]
MKFVSIFYLALGASAMSIGPRHGRGGGRFGNNGGAVDANVPQDDNNNNNDANNGAADGANNGVVGDVNDGVVDVNDGTTDDANDGVVDDVNDGVADDTNDGTTDGTTDGTNDGTTDGTNDGTTDDANNGVIDDGTTDDTTNGGDAVVADGQTLVFFEVNGVPGNECLTFRNNGEIVDAACVNEAIDRQITPTTLNGQDVLRVQRTFTAGFRPDLVDVQACVGFNGTAFRAEDCAAQGIEFVTFANGQLTASGGACASGHDDLAQVTVDATGGTCATFTTTEVAPAAA